MNAKCYQKIKRTIAVITIVALNLTAHGKPTERDYVKINGLKWAKGNLVAKKNNRHQCQIGAPTDYGLYFQFGSLIGWAGGANGTGTGKGKPKLDKAVWPIAMSEQKLPTEWPTEEQDQTKPLSNYYFNYPNDPWGTHLEDIGPFNLFDGSGTLRTGRYAAQGIGDPCTYYLGDAWRMPTIIEINELFNQLNGEWGSNWSWKKRARQGAHNAVSQLFFPASGYRHYANGQFYGVTKGGYYWSSSAYYATLGYNLYFHSKSVYPQLALNRSDGLPVRCVSPVSPVDHF